MRLIGFAGKLGTGKDTAYQLLSGYSVREKSCSAVFRRLAFADPLKEIAMIAFGGQIRNYRGSVEDKNEIIHPWNVSARQIMQFIGTEMFRDTVKNLCPHVGSDFWVMKLQQEVENSDPDVITCVTDVRFQNEADWIIKNHGIIIHILREGQPFSIGLPEHISEKDFIPPKERYYEVRNDGTRLELLNALLSVITQHFYLYGK
jgi:hypothetical protein